MVPHAMRKRRKGRRNSCTRRPLTGSAVRRNPRSAHFGTWLGNEVAAAPVAAVHAEMGVRVTVPPCTETIIDTRSDGHRSGDAPACVQHHESAA
eukprot:1223199-Pleurochrysis_carterae.AAC.1